MRQTSARSASYLPAKVNTNCDADSTYLRGCSRNSRLRSESRRYRAFMPRSCDWLPFSRRQTARVLAAMQTVILLHEGSDADIFVGAPAALVDRWLQCSARGRAQAKARRGVVATRVPATGARMGDGAVGDVSS